MDIHSILATHQAKNKRLKKQSTQGAPKIILPSMAEIPDIFFDEILVKFKLNRIEIMALMYLYRHVWCRPNLYELYGIGQVLSHSALAEQLSVPLEDLHTSLRKLENLGFIQTIRSGQYFVRKYFTEEFDQIYGHKYDEF